MSGTEFISESPTEPDFFPGQFLAKEREVQGLSQEYVAGKLHLRVRMVSLLEEDAYAELPQPVFVQGYLRAYAKLLNLDPKPVLDCYSARRAPENTSERILRQKSKEPAFIDTHKRSLAAAAVIIVFLMSYFLLHNHESNKSTALQVSTADKAKKAEHKQEFSLTDLSKMDANTSPPVTKSSSESSESNDG